MQKTIIVTGAAGDLGSVVAKKLALHGYNVVAILRKTTPELNQNNIHCIENCDLTNEQDAMRAVKETVEKFENIYALLNIAGGFIWKTINDTSIHDIDHMINVNFKTMFNITKAARPFLEQQETSRIINVGAAGALKADMGMAAYAISKCAVMRYSEALSVETSAHLTVNTILPTIIDTKRNRQDMPDADFDSWQTVDEISDKFLFLLSSDAAKINGQQINVSESQ